MAGLARRSTPSSARVIRRAAQGEFVRWDAEIYGRAGGKETIIIDASLMPVKDEHGKVVFIAAEGRDITEKKAYEREIARQREELAQARRAEDAVLRQHQPRVPHAADADAGPARGCAGRRRGAARRAPARAGRRWPSATACGCRSWSTRCSISRASRPGACRPSISRPTSRRSRTISPASFRSACEKAGLTLTIDTPPLAGAGLRRSRDVGEDRPQSPLERLQVHASKAGSRSRCPPRARQAVLRVSDTGTGIPDGRAAAHLRALPSRRGRARAHPRRHRHRACAGAGAGRAAQGHGAVESDVGRGTTFTVRMPFGSAICRRIGSRPPARRPRRRRAPRRLSARRCAGCPTTRGRDELDTPRRGVPRPARRRRARRASCSPTTTPTCATICAGCSRRDYEVDAVADGEAALAAARRRAPRSGARPT